MIDLKQGDCLDVLQDFPDESIDLVITSPPYDNLRNYNGAIESWSFEKFQNIAGELFRVLKRGGCIVWIVADATADGSETGTSFKQALFFKDCGFRLFDTMIWNKNSSGAIGALNRYENVFEYMFVLSKGRPKTINLIRDKPNKHGGLPRCGNGARESDDVVYPMSTAHRVVKQFGRRHNVWNINAALSKSDRCGHPAPFPVQLAKDHIISWSNEGDIILDCFMGSGSTGVACVNTNRSFIGIELDEHYFDIAKNRIEETQAAMTNQGN